MAHEIENMFFVGETPWHVLGNRLIEAPSCAEALKQAGLDWTVKTVPLFLADGTQVKSAKATVRENDNRVLGVVGDRYCPLQNSEAFSFFDPFVQSGLVQLETAGSLREGQRIWILARIAENSDVDIGPGDSVRKFLMLSNSHDGTLSVRVGFTPVRIVCANTLAGAHSSAESQLIRLRHHASVARNLEDLREIINLANRSFEASAEKYRFLASKRINASDLKKYVKIILGHEKTAEDDLSSRALNQIEQIETLFHSGRGANLVTADGTFWGAYNAVTEYFSHHQTENSDKRYQSLWFGANSKRSIEALDLAVEMSKAA